MAKYEISNVLRESIEADMDNGIQWKLIAQEHDVEIGVIRSIHSKRKFQQHAEEVQKGGVIRYWGNLRLTDGLPSPVTTYHISELENAK